MRRSVGSIPPLLVLATPLLAWAPASAQESAGPPAIVVAGSGVVEVVPDHAILTLGVQVQDSVAALAAREMDRRLAAMSDTLADLGFPRDSLPSARFTVTPMPWYGDDLDRPPVYRAISSVRVTVRDLDQLPSVIMASLAAGANSVTGLDFRSDDEEAARLQALDQAVAAAERDARRLARAAGVELGEIREIRTSGTDPGRVSGAFALMEMEVARGAAGYTAITPSRIPVEARVQVTWRIR